MGINNWPRLLPYLSLALVAILVMIFSNYVIDTKLKNLLDSVLSSSIFFFVSYLFYDIIKQFVIRNEKKYLVDYLKNKISNDIFIALYFLKKILHGYNLDTNTLKNILSIVYYSKNDLVNALKNQSFIGFQIFKNTDEVRTLFGNALNDNFILKYSDHVDSISLLRIANNLAKLESMLKNESNFEKSAESGIEFLVVDGSSINPENDEKQLLLKKTAHENRYIVYDSGYFADDEKARLLFRYTLHHQSAQALSAMLYETFALMKRWLPDVVELARNESRFRLIKGFFAQNTHLSTAKSKIYVSDIIEN